MAAYEVQGVVGRQESSCNRHEGAGRFVVWACRRGREVNIQTRYARAKYHQLIEAWPRIATNLVNDNTYTRARLGSDVERPTLSH